MHVICLCMYVPAFVCTQQHMPLCLIVCVCVCVWVCVCMCPLEYMCMSCMCVCVCVSVCWINGRPWPRLGKMEGGWRGGAGGEQAPGRVCVWVWWCVCWCETGMCVW